MRLKLWNMKPISRLRIRERSAKFRFSTVCPLSWYLPPVGVSSSPMIDKQASTCHSPMALTWPHIRPC